MIINAVLAIALVFLCYRLAVVENAKVSNRIVLSFRSTSNKDRVQNLCVSSKVLIICGGQWSLRSHKCRTYFPHFSPLEAVLTHGSKLSTTNWIERLNRSYKRTLHMRAAMRPFCWGSLTKGRGNRETHTLFRAIP